MSSKILSTADNVSAVGVASYLADKLQSLGNQQSLVFIKDREGNFVKGVSLVEETDVYGDTSTYVVLDFE